ncbi:hypothetical protein J2Z53_002328 [Clostridium moniliforme]|uniref:Apea-like HEPN domain-containing protein n=1 Tax=Clostridium moniliforme TaxID=39489 RepID=A0ABS4F3A8_9CLOT|nr:hypothetical protein [Clostridium moniliforme]MBP1890716.1 hypothetical protein [Clostridium moniliforme]
MDLGKFKEIIKAILFRCDIEDGDNKIKIVYRDLEFEVESTRLDEISNNLNKMNKKDSIGIYSNNYCETLVRNANNRRFMMSQKFMEKYANINDEQNKIKYELSKASDEYIIMLLEKLSDLNMLKEFRRNSLILGSIIIEREKEKEKESNDFFEFLRLLFRQIDTLKIKSEENKSYNEFEKLSNSYLFNLAFNLEIPVIEVKGIDEFISSERITSIRRRKEELDPPKRKYIPDLVYHYQMAISSDSPFLQYISYYHIMEHFFEKIYNEELVKLVQYEISNPNFSIKRESDIKKVIKVINKKLQSHREEFSVNEKEALELVLLRYIDIEKLKRKIDEYDSSLLEYYKNEEVLFSGGSKINFELTQHKDIIKKISLRVYKTRNSLVHSKETDMSKYVPFKHDKKLIREIPLMRFIAEEIILMTSELL